MRGFRLACLGAALAALFAFTACGGGSSGDDTGDDDDDAAVPDAGVIPEGFTELIGRDWTISPGEEYKCIGITVEEDMWINVFHTPNPNGEHHAVLTKSDGPGGFGNTQLGEYDCEVNTLDLQMLFASGVGTDNLALPAGVAIKVEAGTFLHLNLHLFNTLPADEISAHSAIFGKLVDPVTPANEAEMVFAGTFNIDIPANSVGTASGGCTFQQPATLFAYWPHMHQSATYQKVTLTQGGVDTFLHDEEFFFDDQLNYPLDPVIQIAQGDSINVECTYDNLGNDQPLEYGDSSNKEMCFTGLYRYPKQASTLFDCATGLPF